MRYQITSYQMIREMLQTLPLDDSCLEWPRYRNPSGYGQVGIGCKVRLVHRVAYELSTGPIPEGHGVLHRCDNPACFRPNHLFTGTDADNAKDCIAKGRRRYRGVKGDLQPGAKLTTEIVRKIKKLCSEGCSQASLARAYGVSQGLISSIKLGHSWSHID